jgi:hypothetical protein
MDASENMSLAAIIISIIALFQSSNSLKEGIVLNLKSILHDRASECNKFIDPISQCAPKLNAHVSAVVTAINYAEDDINQAFNHHWFLLQFSNKNQFIIYFYKALHTSIQELVKQSLNISDHDPRTSPTIQQQQTICRNFFSKIL